MCSRLITDRKCTRKSQYPTSVPLKSGTGSVTGPSSPPALAAGAPATAIPTINTSESMKRRIVEPSSRLQAWPTVQDRDNRNNHGQVQIRSVVRSPGTCCPRTLADRITNQAPTARYELPPEHASIYLRPTCTSIGFADSVSESGYDRQ